MHAGAVRKLCQVQIFLDSGEHEIARPVYGAVPAGTGVRKGDNPLDLRCVFLQQSQADRNGPALGIPRQHRVKGHSVQFQEFVPAGIRHKPDDLTLVKARAVAHDAMQLPVQKHAEVQLAVIHDLPGIVVRFDERVGNRGRNHLHNNFFCTAHSLTTSYSPLPLWFSFVNVSVTAL